MAENASPICPYSHSCGGCQDSGLPYGESLARKQRRAEALLGSFGRVESILGMEQPLHSRYKVVRSFGLDKKRRPVCGIYRPGSHTIVPVENCLIEEELCGQIARDIFSLLPEFRIPVYDERSGTGYLRHILLRRSLATGRVLLTLVGVSPIFQAQKHFLKKLLALHPEIETVVLNVNDRFGPVILGSREKLLYGDGTIEDRLCSLRFRLSSRSFYQVNPVQAEKLYGAALDYAGLTGRETLLDAYCGVGTIGLCAAGRARQVVGVELNRDAVGDAIANARLNRVKNAWFTAADAGEYLERMASGKVLPDVVIMDPPRAGSSERFLSSLLKAGPERVVYVSCCPETLARDLERLRPAYRAERIQPVDMFPFTDHIEAVVQLTKGEMQSKKIRVDFSR